MPTTATQNGIQKLYHYQRFDDCHLSDTLKNNRIRCSDPARLNDPWDLRPLYSAAGVNQDACFAQWQKFFARIAESADDELVLSEPKFLCQAIESLNENSRKLILERWRIYSLTPHRDSLLMWAHYAERHTGICLEFDAAVPLIGNALEVSYQMQRPIIDCNLILHDEEMARYAVLTKSSVWAYEHEYRILAQPLERDSAPATSLAKTKDNFLDLPPGAITGIILGSKVDAEKVQLMVANCQPTLKVYRANPDDSTYALNIEQM